MTEEQKKITEAAKRLTKGVRYRVAHYSRNGVLIGGPEEETRDNMTFIEAMSLHNGFDQVRPFSQAVVVEEFKNGKWQKADLKALEKECQKVCGTSHD